MFVEMGFHSTWREENDPVPLQVEMLVSKIDGRDVSVHGDMYQFSIEVPFSTPPHLRGVSISTAFGRPRTGRFAPTGEARFDHHFSISAETVEIAQAASATLSRGARDALLDLVPHLYSLLVRDGRIIMYTLDRDSQADFVIPYITEKRFPERLVELAKVLETGSL